MFEYDFKKSVCVERRLLDIDRQPALDPVQALCQVAIRSAGKGSKHEMAGSPATGLNRRETNIDRFEIEEWAHDAFVQRVCHPMAAIKRVHQSALLARRRVRPCPLIRLHCCMTMNLSKNRAVAAKKAPRSRSEISL